MRLRQVISWQYFNSQHFISQTHGRTHAREKHCQVGILMVNMGYLALDYHRNNSDINRNAIEMLITQSRTSNSNSST